MCKQATNLQMFDVIKKQWADRNDIMILASCSEAKASELKKEMTENILKSGKRIHDIRFLPMKTVIDFLEIDEKRIIRNAKIEHEMMLKEKAAAATATQD